MPQAIPGIVKGLSLLWSTIKASKIATTILTLAATTAVSKALAPKIPRATETPLDIEYTDTLAPRRIVYGQNKIGGMNVLPPIVTGAEGEFLHQVLALAGHEINSIGAVYFNDDILGTLDSDGNVTSGKYDGKASVRKYLGTSTQTADPVLSAALSEWTSDHRGRGIAYLALRYKFDQETYKNGKPDVTAIVQGKKVYDPRLDTSPGANPTDDTYAAYSDNPALCLADYLVASYGLEETPARVDWALVVTAANLCDESVAIPGDTQKRYTCNVVLDAIAPFENNIETLTQAMMGVCYYSGGKWRMYAGAWGNSAFTLGPDDVAGEISIQTANSRKADGYYNSVRGQFVDPDRNYQPVEFEPIINNDYVLEDGERIYVDVSFPTCNNQYEAQRNAILISRQSRRQRTVTGVFSLSAFKIRPYETGTITLPEVGWTNQTVRCVGWRFRPDPAVELTLQEAASTDFSDPSSGTYVTPASVSVTNPAVYRPGTPTGFAAVQEIESILLSWNAPGNSVPGILYQVFEHSSSTPFSAATQIYEGADTQVRVPRTDTDTRYFWVRSYYSASGGFSDETPSGAGLATSGKPATVSGYITNEAVALEATSTGVINDFSPAAGFFKVFSGATDVTSSATFAIVSETDLDGDLNTADDTPVSGQVKGYYRVTALTADTGILRMSATYGTVTITKDFTVTSAKDGAAGASLLLDKSSVAIPAANDGSNSDFTNAAITASIFEAGLDVSTDWTVTASPSSGITGSLSGKTYTISGMTVDTGVVEFTASRSGYDDLIARCSVIKVRAGAIGPEGPGGELGGISAILSPEFAAVMAYADGTVISFDPAQGQFSLFLGEENITGNATFSASAEDCTGTVNTATDTPVAGRPKGYYRVTAMTADTAKLTITASVSTNLGNILQENGFDILQEDGFFIQTEGAFSLTKSFTLAKSKVGYEIVSTLPTTNLFEGRIVFLTTDDKLYRYTGTAWTAAVPTNDLTGQIVQSQIADAAINTAKFAAGIRPVEIVNSLPTAGTQGRTVFLTTDNKLYRDTGTAWTAATASSDISGQLADAQIAALAASKITGQLTNSQIADLAAAKLTGQITNTQISDDSISTPKLQAGSITTAKIAASAITADTIASNTITAAKIAFGTITGDRISANTITASQIAAATITGDKIAANTVTASNIAADTITAGQIAAGAINTDELAANAVTAAKIAAGTITSDKIAANTITAGNIAAATITATQLATNSVTADKIQAGAVTAAKVSVTELSALSANMGNITAGTIVLPSSGFIRSGQTAYNTGTGFYIGNDSGTPKLSIGNSSGKRITWDGTDFAISGGIVVTDSIALSAVTNSNTAQDSPTGASPSNLTLSHTSIGNPVFIVARLDNALISSTTTSTVTYTIALLRGGTTLVSKTYQTTGEPLGGGFYLHTLDQPDAITYIDIGLAAGSYTYAIQVSHNGSGGTTNWADRTLFVQETKR